MSEERTVRLAYLSNSIFHAPIWALYTLLPFIFYKDLHASPFAITLLISTRPLVSFISFYWSNFIARKPHKLKTHLILTSIIGVLPTLFFPFANNPYFFIFGLALYMSSFRAMIPAWMEMLKAHLPSPYRTRLFSQTSSITYLCGLFLPLILAPLLDQHPHLWRLFFSIMAILSCLSLLFQIRLPISKDASLPIPDLRIPSLIKQPWKEFWDLLRTRPDFAQFQIVFMLGGLGLMIMQPALPRFFTDTLELSYTGMAMALSFCKGVGFAMTSPLWARWMAKVNLYYFSSRVATLATLFFAFIFAAQTFSSLIYVAYLIYGVMQAGSELSWNLSGTIFAKEENSCRFSNVNLALVAIRGCIAPAFGALLCTYSSDLTCLLISGLFCLSASCYALTCHKKHLKQTA